MARISPLTRPRDLNELVQMLQDRLREINLELERARTNAAQKGERFQVVRPVDQSDPVRLQDLQELRAQFDTKLNAQGGGGGGAPIPVPGMAEYYAHVPFEEEPDGLRVLFTPTIEPSLDAQGRPLLLLVHRGAYVHWSSTVVPEPPIGCWGWTGTQVLFPLANVPLPGTLLHAALVIRT